MKTYRSKYIHTSFRNILDDLLNDPEFIVYPRDQEVREINNCIIEIWDPYVNLYNNAVRSSPTKYISAELLWYLSGTNDIGFIGNYASMWKDLVNSNTNTVNSAYGNLLFTEKNEHGLTQYQWVIESLKKDKDSRQAFMHFNKPYHQWFGNKDLVCTLQALFHIRKDKYFNKDNLHMTVTMRSNDVIYGFMTDWAFFSVLHDHVYLHLKEYYPRLELGTYTHISHSMHLYERHYDLVKNMLTTDFTSESLPRLNTPILDERGKYLEKYSNILEPVINGEFRYVESDNDLLNYCVNRLKPKPKISV